MKYEKIYNERWKESIKKKDDTILKFKNFSNHAEFFYYYYNKLIYQIIKKKNKNLSILEIGCGRGTASLFLKIMDNNIDSHLLDFSENAINIAKNNFNKYNLKASFYTSSFNDFVNKNKFDFIISLGVLEHIENINFEINKMKKFLKKDGKMIHLIVPEKKNSIQKYFNFINRFFYSSFRGNKKNWLDKETFSKTDNVYRSYNSSSQFVKIFQDCGFKNVEKIEVNPFPTISNIPNYLEHIIIKIYQIVIFIRKYLFFLKNPFICEEKLSRAHFIIASNE